MYKGVALYPQLALSDSFSIGLRGEIFNNDKAGILINDIEILRNHYAKTLNLWKKKFFLNKDKLNKKFDDKFIRMWDYYLTSCEMGFKYRDTCVFQIILSKKLKKFLNRRKILFSKNGILDYTSGELVFEDY